MAMIPENWPTLLAPGLRKVFHTRMRSRDANFKRTSIFPVETSTRAYEDYQGVGELGSDGWSQFEKTGRVSYDGFEAGWKTRLEHREFAKGVTIQRKLLEDALYPAAGIPNSVNSRVEKLADSAAVHRERSAAEIFINAFTDSGVDSDGFSVAGADSVGLCSTAHPATPSNSSTQSNEGTLALTSANVSATRLLMRAFTDDRGELIVVNPDLLLVPPELEETALQIVGTDLEVGSANNTINTNKNRYEVVSWDYLSDANAWFLIDKMLRDQHLVWLDRTAPEFQSTSDFDTLQAKFRGYSRFSRGFSGWQWIYGNNPS